VAVPVIVAVPMLMPAPEVAPGLARETVLVTVLMTAEVGIGIVGEALAHAGGPPKLIHQTDWSV
jgi:hypothetical protein